MTLLSIHRKNSRIAFLIALVSVFIGSLVALTLGYLEGSLMVEFRAPLVTLACAIIIWLCGLFYMRFRARYLDWFSPYILFGFLYLVTSLGRLYTGYLVQIGNEYTYLRLVALGLFGFTFGSFFSGIIYYNRADNKGLDLVNLAHLWYARQISETVMWLAALGMVVSQMNNSIALLKGNITYGESQFSYTSTYYVRLLSQFLFVPSLTMASYVDIIIEHRLPRTRIFAAIGVYSLILFLSGTRMAVFVPWLAILLVVHYKFRPFNLKDILIIVISVAIITDMIATYRFNSGEPITELARHELHRIITISMFTVFLNDFGSPASIGTHLIDWFPGVIDWLYGRTYINAILNFVPGFVFGGSINRPFLSASYLYKHLIEGGNFNPNQGYGFSLLGEAYMNFGLLGTFLVLFMVGYILHYFYNKAMRGKISLPSYIVIYTAFFPSLRSDSVGLLKNILYGLAILTIISILARYFITINRPRSVD